MSIRRWMVCLLAPLPLLCVLVSAGAKPPQADPRDDFRTPVLPQLGAGEMPQPDVTPDDARILRAMPSSLTSVPGLYEMSQHDIRIVKKCIVNKVDPPRFFPFNGMAQLHHCHWKCTVTFTETIKGDFPYPFRTAQPREQVIYITLDHLHRWQRDAKPTQIALGMTTARMPSE